MIDKRKLAEAARAQDNLAAGETLDQILTSRGVSADDALYVAEQRALRMIVALRGEEFSPRMTLVELSALESDLLAKLAAAWIDGLAVGLKVKE